ncbi:MAG: HesA/MoeB/ThiF family protein [Nanoarchaeota archaeon]|nr:HesA/MoeB/ThiF family protein [DPANN group archaeon]MBL7116339.1 HesA/MoeB/ThiF family protein [Nanoarchaeota archaeon]
MRYSRQEIIIGNSGQETLEKKTVAVVGVGAIGTVSSELLARAGINLIVIDRDVVELNNLQRQLLYNEEDIGKPKALVAEKKLKKINSKIKIRSYCKDLSFENINILKNADLILDCTDNFETRFLINDYCLKNKKPWIYAAGIRKNGTMMNFFPNNVCFRCIFKDARGLETCETAGVFGATTTVVGSLQTINAIKILLGKPVSREMVRIDVCENRFEKIKVKQRKNCAACNGVYEYLDGKKGSKAVKLCGRNTYQIKGAGQKDFRVINDRVSVFKDGRALIKAKSEKEARSLYSKYVGN